MSAKRRLKNDNQIQAEQQIKTLFVSELSTTLFFFKKMGLVALKHSPVAKYPSLNDKTDHIEDL